MIQIESFYYQQLDKWCRLSTDEELYFPTFCQRLENQLEICVSSDQRIVTSIKKSIKNYDYIQFTSRAEHRSQCKSRLKKIIRVLAEYQFINLKNCQELLVKLDNFYLFDRFNSFIKNVEDTKKGQQVALQPSQIEHFWKGTIEKNFEQIWSFLASKRIYDQVIMRLYEVCQPCIKKYSMHKIKQINDYYQHNIKYLKQTKQISSTIHDLFSTPSNPWQNQQYNQLINTYITQKSLFLNEQKMEMAFTQIKDIIATIKCGVKFGQVLTYELYGSIRTGFALVQQSDGDININPTKDAQLTRTQKIQYLSEIYQALTDNPLKKLNCPNIQVFTFDKIKVPFIKLKFQYSRHTKNVLKHVDLIVSSPNGVENSKVLEMYSKSEYIIKFGNLIKLWAKKKTLINAKMPIQGLSSYGVVLMALFYLIKTDQAPYVIQTPNGYRLQKNLLQQKDCKSLLDNFKGFLQFYKCNGPFFNEKMIVCLMCKPKIDLYDKFLVNMYDFVDKSNPGRIPKSLSDKFFGAVNKAYKMLANKCEIREIMRYQE